MNTVEVILFIIATLLAISVVASKVAGKFGVPALLVFLLIGMLSGSEGIAGIYFDNAYYAQTLGIVALVYILFSGGLDSDWKEIRPIIKRSVAISVLGTLITCILVGVFSMFVFNFTWAEGFLVGAIISSTDAAAVFSTLRVRSIGLKHQTKSLLEFESGTNDPMAVFLTTMFLQIIVQQNSATQWAANAPFLSTPLGLTVSFLQQMIIGVLLGVASGKLMGIVLNAIKLEFEGLYPVLTLALVLIVYTVTQAFGGSGYLSVFISGLVLNGEKFIFKKSLTLFHDGIAWVMQIAMFLTLGLLVFPSQITHVIGTGFLLSGFLIIIARPISVYLSLCFSKISFKEKTFISWVGLRGAVPIVLATFPLTAGIEKADMIFNIVFFVVLTSVAIQGTTVALAAKWLSTSSISED